MACTYLAGGLSGALRRALACQRLASLASAEPLLGPLHLDLDGIAWVIVGAESGPGARPMRERWVKSLRDDCITEHVAFFYKQHVIAGRKISCPLLDGVRWTQYPDVEALPISTGAHPIAHPLHPKAEVQP